MVCRDCILIMPRRQSGKLGGDLPFFLGWKPPALQADEHRPHGQQSQGFSLGWKPPALQADEHRPHGRRQDASLGILDAADRAAQRAVGTKPWENPWEFDGKDPPGSESPQENRPEGPEEQIPVCNSWNCAFRTWPLGGGQNGATPKSAGGGAELPESVSVGASCPRTHDALVRRFSVSF